jgi:hypothetical protein
LQAGHKLGASRAEITGMLETSGFFER